MNADTEYLKNRFNNLFISNGIAKLIQNKPNEFIEALSNSIPELTQAEGWPFSGYNLSELHVDINIVNGLELDTEAFKNGNLISLMQNSFLKTVNTFAAPPSKK
jgi:hypothetical protein